jgi:hypothetical protein
MPYDQNGNQYRILRIIDNRRTSIYFLLRQDEELPKDIWFAKLVE